MNGRRRQWCVRPGRAALVPGVQGTLLAREMNADQVGTLPSS